LDKVIDSFNHASTQDERNQIYEDHLHKPLMKLSENVLNTFRHFYYIGESFQDIQRMMLSHIVCNLHNYQPSKGKSFGYFSTIAKYWCIQNNTLGWKKHNQYVSTDFWMDDKDRQPDTLVAPTKQEHPQSEYFDQVQHLWKTDLFSFPLSDRQRKLVPQILHSINNDTFENRKAFTKLFLKEQNTPTNRNRLNDTVQKMTKINRRLYQYYLQHGTLEGYSLSTPTTSTNRRNKHVTAEDVVYIHQFFLFTDLNLKTIAGRFNISKDHVYQILRGTCWKSIHRQFQPYWKQYGRSFTLEGKN
jgi:hypothetical protein